MEQYKTTIGIFYSFNSFAKQLTVDHQQRDPNLCNVLSTVEILSITKGAGHAN
jgi:hypothetical protein